MEKILIIEDDKDINEMLQKLLKVNGYDVVSAYSGTEGVLLHNKYISLIILDLMLPGKNGEEIISELQAKSVVPIIVTTAIHDMDKKLDLFELGADDYVTKPFNNNELLAR
ncbi:MAG: response regulator transcription factor, partial [Lachnospiraceae bacterium]|nr:response regulator transcription factor [Lachnospiraceae bacterium]